jgi:hypothetical protein
MHAAFCSTMRWGGEDVTEAEISVARIILKDQSDPLSFLVAPG